MIDFIVGFFQFVLLVVVGILAVIVGLLLWQLLTFVLGLFLKFSVYGFLKGWHLI